MSVCVCLCVCVCSIPLFLLKRLLACLFMKVSDVGKDEKSDEDVDDVLRVVDPDPTASGFLPQDSGKTTEVLDSTLKDVSPR